MMQSAILPLNFRRACEPHPDHRWRQTTYRDDLDREVLQVTLGLLQGVDLLVRHAAVQDAADGNLSILIPNCASARRS